MCWVNKIMPLGSYLRTKASWMVPPCANVSWIVLQTAYMQLQTAYMQPRPIDRDIYELAIILSASDLHYGEVQRYTRRAIATDVVGPKWMDYVYNPVMLILKSPAAKRS